VTFTAAFPAASLPPTVNTYEPSATALTLKQASPALAGVTLTTAFNDATMVPGLASLRHTVTAVALPLYRGGGDGSHTTGRTVSTVTLTSSDGDATLPAVSTHKTRHACEPSERPGTTMVTITRDDVADSDSTRPSALTMVDNTGVDRASDADTRSVTFDTLVNDGSVARLQVGGSLSTVMTTDVGHR
jgi:hypothetical protein